MRLLRSPCLSVVLFACNNPRITEQILMKCLYCRIVLNFVGYEVITAVVMDSSIFWDITTRNPLKVNRCFGVTT
jgi:hypothetical protein